MANPRNNRIHGVTKFCLAMEEHRRTDVGRVRTAKEFVGFFFPYDASGARDQMFVHMPNEIRGPVLSQWGIRGAKAALRDDDEKVRDVVHDALVAGDIDEGIFEEGVNAQIVVDWLPLGDWWSFWRKGKLTGVAIQKALATARELGLIDDQWFLLNIEGRGGKLKGTDVVCDTLSKDQIVQWVRRVHESGDGSPAGLVAALGWETILAKTAQDALLFALDAFARKAGLVTESEPTQTEAPAPLRSATPGMQSPSSEPATAKHPKPEEAHLQATLATSAAKPASATANAPIAPNPAPLANPAVAVPPAASSSPSLGGAASPAPNAVRHDSGFPVAIPDMPVEETTADEGPKTPLADTGWSGGAVADESPKLAEARAKMMEMLEQKAEIPKPWEESEVPAKPSSLEWPEPPPISAQLVEDPSPAPSPVSKSAARPPPPPLPSKGAPPTSKR